MHHVLSALRRLASRLSIVLAVLALIGRAGNAWRRGAHARAQRRRTQTDVLPSLFDRHPGATTAARRSIGLRGVSLDKIVGTMRHPSQNTADFRPLPRLRGRNWSARWQRITGAMDRLAVLPPVDLVQVGDEFYVADGHNRVAAALLNGAVEIDADVTQLLVAGVRPTGASTLGASAVAEAQGIRQAGQGRHTRTVTQASTVDRMSREELVRGPDERT